MVAIQPARDLDYALCLPFYLRRSIAASHVGEALPAPGHRFPERLWVDAIAGCCPSGRTPTRRRRRPLCQGTRTLRWPSRQTAPRESAGTRTKKDRSNPRRRHAVPPNRGAGTTEGFCRSRDPSRRHAWHRRGKARPYRTWRPDLPRGWLRRRPWSAPRRRSWL